MEATVAIDLPSVAAFQVKLQPRWYTNRPAAA